MKTLFGPHSRPLVCQSAVPANNGASGRRLSNDAQKLQAPSKIAHDAATAGAFKKLYDHPASNAAMTFATTSPVGLVLGVVAAAVLRTKEAARS
jgi:hypothetical protein